MRSVVVVLPASMWAMIPMLRTRSSATEVATVVISSLPTSPAIVREGLVRLRHAVDVVLLLERAALLVERVDELARELLGHALLAPIARVLDKPTESERTCAPLRNLDGNLVVGATDTARTDLENRSDALDRLLQHLDLRLSGFLGREPESPVHDLLGDGLLAVQHHAVHELRHQDGIVD